MPFSAVKHIHTADAVQASPVPLCPARLKFCIHSALTLPSLVGYRSALPPTSPYSRHSKYFSVCVCLCVSLSHLSLTFSVVTHTVQCFTISFLLKAEWDLIACVSVSYLSRHPLIRYFCLLDIVDGLMLCMSPGTSLLYRNGFMTGASERAQ